MGSFAMTGTSFAAAPAALTWPDQNAAAIKTGTRERMRSGTRDVGLSVKVRFAQAGFAQDFYAGLHT
ncbi:hypothetical protein PBS_58920 [Paraburkholderia sp. 2C]